MDGLMTVVMICRLLYTNIYRASLFSHVHISTVPCMIHDDDTRCSEPFDVSKNSLLKLLILIIAYHTALL